MCELLGMSANVPTDICFSFSALIERGGAVGPHKDGWGISFYENRACHTFRDSGACCESPMARLLEACPIKSHAVVAHIRQANCGQVALENTHPFTRELWGRYWTYAHNGQLKEYQHLSTGHFYPVGQTDSEHAFCWLLYKLLQRFPDEPADRREVFTYIASLAEQLRQSGVFNMLLSDGEYIMAYCSTQLHWITRRAPFGLAKLLDKPHEVDFQQQTSPADVVTLIATTPMTSNEQWQTIAEGSWRLFYLGECAI